jgi:hypothetical protein
MGVLSGVAVVALVVGFLAGFVTFRRSLRWCPGCGAFLRCPDCPGGRLQVRAPYGAVMPVKRSR